MKATEQYINSWDAVYWTAQVNLRFKIVDEILKCDHSDES